MGFVVDASVLILFAKSGHLDLLENVVGQGLVVPRQALDETSVGPGPDALLLRERYARFAVDADAARMRALRARDPGLGPGDVAVLDLAHAGGHVAVTDDRRARRWADALGIAKTGTVGILLRSGAGPRAAQAFDDLLSVGLRLSPELAVEARRRLQGGG